MYVNVFVDTLAFEFYFYVLFRMLSKENIVNIFNLNMLKQHWKLRNESLKKTESSLFYGSRSSYRWNHNLSCRRDHKRS